MNAMRQLDSGNRDGRIVERLEAGHRGTAPFDRAMVLARVSVGLSFRTAGQGRESYMAFANF